MRRTPHSGTAAETRIHSVEPVTEPQMLDSSNKYFIA